MARKTAEFRAGTARDEGKLFLLTEMSAMKSEKWATKALLALARSGADIPEDIASMGLAGVAMFGMKMFGGIKFEDAEPLLDEMMLCVAFVPDPSRMMVTRSPPWPDDIEEVETLLKLRQEVFNLHVGFSLAGLLQKLPAPTPETPTT